MVVLLVTAAGRLCAIATDEVREVMRPQPTQAFPSGPDFVQGVAIIRGEPTPVIDLARLLGAIDAPPPERFVTLRVGARTAALAVGSVVGSRTLDPRVLVEMPPLLRDSGSEHVARLSRLDADLVLVLNSARTVPEALWAKLDAPGERS